MTSSLFLPNASETLWNRRTEEQVAYVLDTLPGETVDDSEAVLLAAGCGTGRLLRALSDETSCRLIGFDADHQMLAYGRRQSDSVELFQSDLREFTVSEPVDAIICMFTAINYLQTNADLVTSLNRFGDALAEDGVVLVDASNFMAHLVEGYREELTESVDHDDGRIKRHVHHDVDLLENQWEHRETLRVFTDDELVDSHTATHELRYFTANEFRFAHSQSMLADREMTVSTGYDDEEDRLIYTVGVVP